MYSREAHPHGVVDYGQYFVERPLGCIVFKLGVYRVTITALREVPGIESLQPSFSIQLRLAKEECRMSEGRVLVVDDEVDVRKSVRLILSKAGYDVVEAEDGEAGIRAVKRGDNPFALGAIVCDLKMPKMGGMEAIPYFRSQFPHASIIVLSGEVTTERARVLLKQGVSDILSKPIVSDTLLAAIKKSFDTEGWKDNSTA